MAKGQPNKQQPSSPGKVSASEIREAKEKIRDAHSLGEQVKEKCGTRTSEPALRDAAHELGITPALAKRYRVLATEEKGFTTDQLEKLLGLFDKNSRALNITHVLSLLKIKD
jgi:transposase